MRQLADPDRIRQFMRTLGSLVKDTTRLYFTGGATAVLLGWRDTTIDVDIRIFPESDAVLRAIPQLKEELQLNVELACPSDFIPVLDGWEGRSLYISTEGSVSFYHYDLHAQALSKIERGHGQDLQDVQSMFTQQLIDPQTLSRHFEAIEPLLYRYPAIHPPSFRQALEEILRQHSGE